MTTATAPRVVLVPTARPTFAVDVARSLAGNTRASTPPNDTCRNGVARTSRMATVASMNATGRRMTVFAHRYQNP